MRVGVVVIGAVTLGAAALSAQDRLKTMPGYDQYQRVAPLIPGSAKLANIRAQWAPDGKSFTYDWDGKHVHFTVATKTAVDEGAAVQQQRGFPGRGGGGAPARGRQFESAVSPDGKHKALYRDRNLYVSDSSGANEKPITTDGSAQTRIKYGTASWVYGEELEQRTAFWWSPDGSKLAFYGFDESGIPDFYLPMHQVGIQDTIDVEAYPKPGVPNPVVEVFVYDVALHRTMPIDVRDGKPFTNDAMGHYVYNVAWSPDGKELTFNRKNRKQNALEFVGCSAETGKCRVIIREDWPTGWLDNHNTPADMQLLSDKKRFLWMSERNGYRNYYLYDWSGKLLNAVTNNTFDVAQIVKVDEANNALYYMGRDGDNYMKEQLHRVALDGKGDKRLTDPAYNHTVDLSPDAKYFVDVAQTHDVPPFAQLMDNNGKLVAPVVGSDLTTFDQLGLKKAESFTYKAADGVTTLHGMIQFPSNFDPKKVYPVLVPVYGGPASASNTSRETFVMPNPTAEYGFLIVNLDSRATPGMGKRQLDAIYLKLGQTEMDDMAEGVKALWARPYIDKNHVGVYGTSYGGYTSVMEALRHPEVFAAASASSPPTDWRNYDTIYTERYMWLPSENAEGYDKGSAMTYAGNLRSRLMLYFGTSDNNVHPTNMMQLVSALQRAGKSFDMQVGPDMGHSGLNPQRMMEFFIENLVMH